VDGPRGLGRALFAAILLMIGGVLNIIYGIAAISNSHVFVHNTHYVFGDLKTWGWVTLIIGVVEILASMSLFAGGMFGRVFGIIVGSLAAIEALLAIPAYPALGIAIFALSVWIVYGLAVYRGPEVVAYEEIDASVPTTERVGSTMEGTMPGRRPG
jgi:hypothetical protein